MNAAPTDLQVRARLTRGQFRLSADFSVAAGEIVAILGPNGSGKSTLLRLLAGLISLADGRIELQGAVLDDPTAGAFTPPESRPVGLVFQDYRLFPHLTVLDNVAFAARARKVRRTAARAQARVLLSRFGVADLADRKPSQLSGGQSQRVALARTLAAEPRLLLLDEPLAALDAATKLSVRTELRSHLLDFAGPTLLVTHDPLEAMVMADRLIVIEHGEIVQQGSPADVARRPATEYVARLVGLNLYRGVRIGGTQQVRLDSGFTMTASGFGAAADAVDAAVLVAVRPSSIVIHRGRPDGSSARNVWQGAVRGMELLTDRVRIEVGGDVPALVDVTADAVADLGLTGGAAVWLSSKGTDVVAYPASS